MWCVSSADYNTQGFLCQIIAININIQSYDDIHALGDSITSITLLSATRNVVYLYTCHPASNSNIFFLNSIKKKYCLVFSRFIYSETYPVKGLAISCFPASFGALWWPDIDARFRDGPLYFFWEGGLIKHNLLYSDRMLLYSD
jgi:hypothetical protein